MTRRVTRRRFLGTAAALVGACTAPARSANGRLRVGVIGLGNRGADNWRAVAEAGGEIVSLCDADERLAGSARKAFPKAQFFADFRAMLDQPGRMDAVVVSTPDHTHALPTLMALRSGLHVYCEKPLTHSVHEARVVTEAAARSGLVTQMGTQIHAGSNYRRVVEMVRSGAIGPVREVHVWVGRGWTAGDPPKETPPAPPGLNFDLWLAGAAERPYHPDYLPILWRRWWDFGGGALADLACHHMDLPFWTLDLGRPTRVEAEGPPPHPHGAPAWMIVRYDFPARGDAPPVRVTWYDNDKRPPQFAEGLLPDWGDGTLFVGDRGMLLADYSAYKLLPEERFAGFRPPEPSIPESVGHHKEWVEACLGNGRTSCHFGYSGPLTEAVLLGVAAYRAERPISWDGHLAGHGPADRYIRKEYRRGWEVA